MRHGKHGIWLALLAATLGLTCAPRDETPPSSLDKGSGPKDPPPRVDKNNLKGTIEAALTDVKSRTLVPGQGFWHILHAILGTGLDTELVVGAKGERVKAIDYIADGKEMPGRSFLLTPYGADVESATVQGMGFKQGHQDQFIAEMAQEGIAAGRVIKVGDTHKTFMDFCRHARMRVSVKAEPKQELSWTIIILGQYFGEGELYKKNAKGEIEYLPWTNQRGEKLSYEDVVRYELNEPIEGAACGGTHRLFGLTWAYHAHLRRGGKCTGLWQEVAEHIERYKELAKRHRNPGDGAFSTQYFKEQPKVEPDLGSRIASTGHILEWLALAAKDAELDQDWMKEAVRAQSLMVLDLRGAAAEGGALYHATHGLNLYHARMFGGPNDPRLAPVALLPKQ